MSHTSSFVKGLKCRECTTPYPVAPVAICEECFGPLEVDYDYAAIKETLTRETLAARLTATRIVARARREKLRVERQINRTRNIRGVDTTKLLDDLMSDRQRSEELRKEATVRLSETKARLQEIEAAANRSLSQTETDFMLRRLAASQEHFPLALEMASMEESARRELDLLPLPDKPGHPPDG